jgi:hypothetical protein
LTYFYIGPLKIYFSSYSGPLKLPHRLAGRLAWGLVFLHKVRMQFEVILSSAHQDLVSCYLDPRSLDLAALQNILTQSITRAVSFWRRLMLCP